MKSDLMEDVSYNIISIKEWTQPGVNKLVSKIYEHM